MVKNLALKIRYPRYILDKIYEVTPRFLWPVAEGCFRGLMRVIHWGRRYTCCLCGARLRDFQPLVARNCVHPGAKICPVCRAGGRHRFAWLVMEAKTNLLDGRPKKMLHVAPEPCLTVRFRKIPKLDYISVDLNSRLAMLKMDITRIQFPDSSFDVIFCSHVLEHIPDDRKALRELRRVLKPGGWAMLSVPIRREKTLEDPSVTDPAGRQARFGYADHVRDIGHDYIERIRECGFTVTKWVCEELYDQEQRTRLGVAPDWIFYCTKENN